MKSRRRLLPLIVLLVVCFAVLPGIAGDKKPTLKINTWSWTSGEVQGYIAGYIIEHAYGYPVEYTSGSSAMVVLGMREGDLDFGIDTWTNNVGEVLNEGYIKGEVIDLGQAYSKAPHGFYVPTFVIKGDEERGIEPMAPDLETLADLEKYWKLFKDPADPSKGRIYGAPSSWEIALKEPKLFEEVGIAEEFNKMDPGTQAGLASAATSAYKKGKPIVFYYYEPTWLMGMYDFTRLEFPDLVGEKELYPLSNKVHVAANPGLATKAPRVVNLLANYQTTLGTVNEILAYKQATGADSEETAIYYLKNYPEQWHQWFPVVFEEEKRLINAVEEALAKEEIPSL